jgi:transmembrane sensor
MKTPEQQPPTSAWPSDRAQAEAAAWVTRLHGSRRTLEAEEGCRRWLAEDPKNAAAFELLTDVWEKSARLRRPFEREVPQARTPRRPGANFSLAAFATAVAALTLLLSAFYFFYLHTDAITTGVGEQRTLVLADGSRVHLNTDTRVIPRFNGTTRRIELDKGEAFFEVARNPNQPFIVIAGDRQVRALGTSFIVRRDEHDIAVTLVEGKVTVAPTMPESRFSALSGQSAQNTPTANNISAPDVLALTPGQRLTIAQGSTPQLQTRVIDSPPIEKVTAWQRGQVDLDDIPLTDAVAEMNRYSKTRLVIQDPNTAAIRVSGIFRAGDQQEFVRAIARIHHIETRIEDQTIVLGARVTP